MTEATTEAPATAKKAPPKREAVVLLLKSEGQPDLKVGKYPMPVRAPHFTININGTDCEAAKTEFKHLKYTYFTYQGVGFWVKGHLDNDAPYTFEFPSGYEFKALKVDRQAQAKAAKAKKAGAADTAVASEESALGAAGAAGEGGDSSGASEGATAAAEPAAPKGKKAKR